jgi:hypothetical protein
MMFRRSRPALVLLAAVATAACGDHTVLAGPDAEAAVEQFQAQAVADRDAATDERRPVIVLDGERVEEPTEALLKSIEVEDIERIEVLKGCRAMAKHGEEAVNGAIHIFTKSYEGPSVEFDDEEEAWIDACVEEYRQRRRADFVRKSGVGWLPPPPSSISGR